jgi:hypothetical protein
VAWPYESESRDNFYRVKLSRPFSPPWGGDRKVVNMVLTGHEGLLPRLLLDRRHGPAPLSGLRVAADGGA